MVLVGTKYVTLKRRVEMFKESMSGYKWKVARKEVGLLEVRMDGGWGGCAIGDRFESLSYRGLSRMMREAGFVTEVNEEQEWMRMVPSEQWRERRDDESEDGCIVTRLRGACEYCEMMLSKGGEEETGVSGEVTVKLAEAGLGESEIEMEV